MSTQALDITDPVFRKNAQPSAIESKALQMINDERDLPFVWLTASATAVLIPFAIVLFVTQSFPWWLGLVYLVANFALFFDRYILMLHNTSHRRLFKRKFRALNHYIPVVLGPLFGETPYTYFAHHVGMHHPENNMPGDLSSTLRFQRDSFGDFMKYFTHFFFAGIYELTRYHQKRGRAKMARMALLGETGWYAAVIALSFWHFSAAFVVFILPFMLCRFLMMAGNWAQHAFIDRSDQANPYKNSITCINSRYNRRCFNDGYHIGHHVKQTRHWTEMPIEFQNNLDKYRDEDAVIFEGVDYFELWLMLMTKRYAKIASHFVDLRDEKRSKEEIIALLQERTQRIAV